MNPVLQPGRAGAVASWNGAHSHAFSRQIGAHLRPLQKALKKPGENRQKWA
jgi:hypothetical protein